METFDLIVLAPVAFFAFKGYQSGLVKEILSLVGIGLAVFLSINYLEPFSQFAKDLLGLQKEYNSFVFGSLLFVLVLIATNLLTYIIGKFLSAIKLTLVNKLLGLLFGGLKAGLIVSAVLLLLAGFGYPNQETQKGSVAYPYLIQLAPAVYNAVALVYPGAEDFSKTIKKTIDDNNPLNKLSI